jgi:hypothetical protein
MSNFWILFIIMLNGLFRQSLSCLLSDPYSTNPYVNAEFTRVCSTAKTGYHE